MEHLPGIEHRATWRGLAGHSFEWHEHWFSLASAFGGVAYLAVATWSGPQSARPSSADTESPAHSAEPGRAWAADRETSDAGAANALGVAYAVGADVESDDAKALSLFARACDSGDAEGCSNLGAMLERGRGAQADVQRSRQLYERACQARVPLACSNLGALYAEGKSVEANRTYAGQLFAWACQAGSATGCENLATLDEQARAEPRAPIRGKSVRGFTDEPPTLL